MAASKFTCSRCLRAQHDLCTTDECDCAATGHGPDLTLEGRPAVPPPQDDPTADQPYHCDDCGRRFSLPQNLARHRQAAHTSATAPASQPPARRRSARREPDAADRPAEDPPLLPSELIQRPREWHQIGHIELQTRTIDDGTVGVFARFIPSEAA